MDQPPRVLFCNCSHAQVVAPQVKGEVLRQLRAAGVEFEAVADLCELAARRDPILRRFMQAGGARIAACFPRAVKWLFHAGGAPAADGQVDVLNMRALSAEQVVAGLLADLPAGRGDAKGGRSAKATPSLEAAVAWVPWFPVIDYERCTNCKKCLSFCLFGVFGVDGGGQVEVREPDHCKTGCPACARVCPSAAIIFPKYGKRPINGDDVRAEDLKSAALQVDVTALVTGDVRSALRARGDQVKKRFVPGRDSSLQAEKQAKYLRTAQSELDIPDTVLADLGCGHACAESSSDDGTDRPASATCGDEQSAFQPAPGNTVDCPCLNYLTKAAAELGIPQEKWAHLTCQCATTEEQRDSVSGLTVLQATCGPQDDCGPQGECRPAGADSACCSCIDYFINAGVELGIPNDVLARMSCDCNCELPASGCGCEAERDRAQPPGASAEEWDL